MLGVVLASILIGRGRAAGDRPPDANPEARPVFLDIDRIVVTVYRGADVASHDMIAMKLELVDDTVILQVKDAMPRLRDAFVRSWNSLGAHPDAGAGGLDVAAGRKRMLAACERIVGPGVVRNVLIVAQSRRVVTPARR